MSDAIEHAFALRVDPHHPVFAGHFPGRPIVPGVLLIDWALAALQDAFPDMGLDASPLELATVKLLRPVPPGAELRIVCRRDTNGMTLRIECEDQCRGQSGVRVDSDPTLTPGFALVASASLRVDSTR